MNLRINPVLDRELRERARSKRTIVVLFVYLAVLAGLVQLVYAIRRATANGNSFDVQQLSGATTGRLLFDCLLFAVIMLCFLVVPALTAAGIAGERDRQTLVPLQVTLLSPRQILVGKLLAGLAFATLLLVAVAPLLGASLILGGVSAASILKGLAMVLLITVTLGSTSLLASTLTRRVPTAFVLSLVIVLVLVIGPFVVYGLQQVFIDRDPAGGGSARDNRAALVFSPLVATADALRDNGSFASGVVSPFRPLQQLARRRDTNGPVNGVPILNGQVINGQVNGPLQPAGAGAPLVAGKATRMWFPMWFRSVLTFLLITVLSLTWAARRLRTPAETGDR
jgi:ABC-2 type transport system permease protein